MKSNAYIISVLVALTMHTVCQSMQAPGKEKKSCAIQKTRRVNDNGLFDASKAGDKAQIICLLENGSNIDTTDGYGRQPLHFAAQEGYTAIVELLLDQGATGIDAPGRYGRQPLHWAAQYGHTATVELLLDRGARGIDVPDKDGLQPIHQAALHGYTAIVELLLDRGATGINAPDYCGCQPLHIAARYGNTAMVELLLDRGATGIDVPDKYDTQPIHDAVLKGHTATVQLLLDRGATGIDAPDKYGWQPIYCAAQYGHTAMVELLLDRGATGIDGPGNDGMQPIHWAVINGQTATVQLLLDRGAAGIDAPDDEGKQPLHLAAEQRQTGTMILLISHGAIVADTMPLHRTMAEVFAQSDFTSIRSIPFDRGPAKTITLLDVFTMAAGQNKQEAVKTIFSMHRTNLTDRNVIDALIGSTTAGHEAIVRMLHNDMSNDRNLRCLVPETLARALSRAVAHCRVEVIDYLIEQDSTYDTLTFSLLRPAGTLLKNILSPYTPSEISASERLSDYKRILTMLGERQCWRSHTLPLIGRDQAASVDREETVSYVLSPIISIPTELWLIILNYLADRHLSEIAK